MNSVLAKEVVCAVLREIQEKQGFECPALTGDTKPLKDIPYFTSDTSIGATGKIAKKLKIEIPPTVNLFGNESGIFSIDKTVAVLCAIADEQGEKGAAA